MFHCLYAAFPIPASAYYGMFLRPALVCPPTAILLIAGASTTCSICRSGSYSNAVGQYSGHSHATLKVYHVVLAAVYTNSELDVHISITFGTGVGQVLFPAMGFYAFLELTVQLVRDSVI